MSVLSNVDLENELVNSNDIRIFPLEITNIKSSTYNLTASEYAWSLRQEKSIFNSVEKVIEIPPHDTGLIATKEVIWVSERICGTYHSKVTIATDGGGHIGTTLDSTWIGHSIIAVHNHTDEKIIIDVDKTFVSIMFHYLNTPTTKQQGNKASQTDKIPFTLSKPEKEYFDLTWKNDSDALLEKVKDDLEYQKLLAKVTAEEKAKKQVKDGKKNKKIKWGTIIGTIAFVLVASWLQTKVPVGSFYYIVLNFLQFAGLSGLFMPFYNNILNK